MVPYVSAKVELYQTTKYTIRPRSHGHTKARACVTPVFLHTGMCRCSLLGHGLYSQFDIFVGPWMHIV